MMKVLIIKLGALGDVVNTFPLAVNIKNGLNAQVHWLVAPLSFPLVEAHRAIDKAILFDKKNLFESLKYAFKQIRQSEYDIVLDLQRLFKSGLFTMVAKGKRKIGFDKKRCKEISWLFPFERIPPSDPDTHMLTQYMEFAKYLGLEHDKIAWNLPWQEKNFECPESNKEKNINFESNSIEVSDLIANLSIQHNYIILNIGATKPANRWEPKYFAKLADMINKTTNCKIVLTGGYEDKASAEIIKDKADCKIIDLCSKTSIKELIIIIDKAKCVISCDTGPMHLATALHTKVIALFGPSNPGRTGPYKGVVVQKKLLCLPCNLKECNNPICMDKIKPEYVMEKVLQEL